MHFKAHFVKFIRHSWSTPTFGSASQAREKYEGVHKSLHSCWKGVLVKFSVVLYCLEESGDIYQWTR